MPFVQSMKQSDQRRLIEILNESVTEAEMEAGIRVFNHRRQTSASPTRPPPPRPRFLSTRCCFLSREKFDEVIFLCLSASAMWLRSAGVRERAYACVCVRVCVPNSSVCWFNLPTGHVPAFPLLLITNASFWTALSHFLQW